MDNGAIDVCASTKCHSESPDATEEDIDDRTYSHAHYPRDRLRLLEVCQQVYNEARLLVFNLNVLKGDIENIKDFLWGDILSPRSNMLSFQQKRAIRVVETSLWLMDVCLLEGCISGEVDDLILRGFGRRYILVGLEKLLIHYACQDPRHRTSGCFGTEAKANIREAVGAIGKNAKVEFIDGLSDSTSSVSE